MVIRTDKSPFIEARMHLRISLINVNPNKEVREESIRNFMTIVISMLITSEFFLKTTVSDLFL